MQERRVIKKLLLLMIKPYNVAIIRYVTKAFACLIIAADVYGFGRIHRLYRKSSVLMTEDHELLAG